MNLYWVDLVEALLILVVLQVVLLVRGHEMVSPRLHNVTQGNSHLLVGDGKCLEMNL